MSKTSENLKTGNMHKTKLSCKNQTNIKQVKLSSGNKTKMYKDKLSLSINM